MDYDNSRAHRPPPPHSPSLFLSDISAQHPLPARDSHLPRPSHLSHVSSSSQFSPAPQSAFPIESPSSRQTPRLDPPPSAFPPPFSFAASPNLGFNSSSRRWSTSTSSTLVSADLPPEHGSSLMAAGEYHNHKDPLPTAAPSDASSAYPTSFSSQLPPLKRPLIDLVTNEWQHNPKYATDYAEDYEEWDPHWLRMGLVRRIPRRVQRYLVIYVSLACIVWLSWKWFIRPGWELRVAMDAVIDKGTDQTFGANMMPAFNDMIQLKELDSSYLPKAKSDKQRLVVVGDVHGCKDELVNLLEKISFRSSTDHLILTGDIIAKGPDSAGVIDLARDLSASCVRGNHEDRTLLAWAEMQAKLANVPGERGSEDSEDASHGDHKDRQLAKQLSHTQIKWLQQCPVILKVGHIPGMGQVSVVHAGLVPGVPLQKQDPYQSMNMRTIDLTTKLPSEERTGTPWEKLWNRYQNRLSSKDRSTVIYGHDSKRGLNIKKYTKGLDSGCVNGGKLTAMIIEAGEKDSDVHQSFVSVKCKQYKKQEEAKT